MNQKEENLNIAALFAGGLFKALGWTIVYYLGTWGSLLGIGLLLSFISKRKEAKK